MRRALVHIGFLLGMALGTNGDFIGFIADRIFCGMHLMAAATDDIGVIVVIAFPCGTLTVIVATHTDTVLLLRGNRGVCAKGDHRLFATFIMIP